MYTSHNYATINLGSDVMPPPVTGNSSPPMKTAQTDTLFPVPHFVVLPSDEFFDADEQQERNETVIPVKEAGFICLGVNLHTRLITSGILSHCLY